MEDKNISIKVSDLENNSKEPKSINEEEEALIRLRSKSSPFENILNYFKDVYRISIKTDQSYLSYDSSLVEDSYTKMAENMHLYSLIPKTIPERYIQEQLEYTAKNDSSYFSNNFFIGPSKGIKFSIYQKKDFNQVINTGLTFEKEMDSFFSLKNNNNIIVCNDGIQIGEIVINNGWIYDTYNIKSNIETNSLSKESYSIVINKYKWGYKFRNTILCNFTGLDFPILDKKNKKVGKIRKENPSNPLNICNGWEGIDYFFIDLPKEAEVGEKILLMGAAIIIDQLYINDISRF